MPVVSLVMVPSTLAPGIRHALERRLLALEGNAWRIGRDNIFPQDAACSRCGWTGPIALVSGTDPLLCYECHTGKEWEYHHLAGKHNHSGLVRLVPGNVHRVLGAWAYDWPDEVRLNPRRSKLLAKIAVYLGLADYYIGLAAEIGSPQDFEPAALYCRAAEMLWRARQKLALEGPAHRGKKVQDAG